MKTESDVKMAYLGDTGTRAEVVDAGIAYCGNCEEEVETGFDGVIISREYYEWLIEKITE